MKKITLGLLLFTQLLNYGFSQVDEETFKAKIRPQIKSTIKCYRSFAKVFTQTEEQAEDFEATIATLKSLLDEENGYANYLTLSYENFSVLTSKLLSVEGRKIGVWLLGITRKSLKHPLKPAITPDACDIEHEITEIDESEEEEEVASEEDPDADVSMEVPAGMLVDEEEGEGFTIMTVDEEAAPMEEDKDPGSGISSTEEYDPANSTPPSTPTPTQNSTNTTPTGSLTRTGALRGTPLRDYFTSNAHK